MHHRFSFMNSIQEEWEHCQKDALILVILLLFPILINLLLGITLSKGVVSSIPMGIVDQDNSALSRQLISYFAENDSFRITQYAETADDLEQAMGKNVIRVGMVIPKGFSQDVVALRSPSVMMLYDGSHMNLTSTAKAKASEILLTMRTGAAMEQMRGRLSLLGDTPYQTAMPIQFETRMLYNPAKNFSCFLLPGYGTMVCQTAIGLTSVFAIRRSTVPQGSGKLIGHIIGKTCFYGLIGALGMVCNLVLQITLFGIPFRGAFWLAAVWSALLGLSVASLGVMASAFFSNRVIGTAAMAVFLLPNSVMTGFTWPLLSMLPFYQWLAKIFPFYYYGDSIRSLFLQGSIPNPVQSILFFVLFIAATFALTLLGLNLTKKEVA